MRKVHVLTTVDSPNSSAFNFPLFFWRKQLLSYDVDITFFLEIDENIYDCDLLFVNSKYFRWWWDEKYDRMLEFFRKAHARTSGVLYFDTTDSTGTPQFDVMPLVGGYYKSQTLKDKTGYLKEYYGSRIYTDYYYQNDNITEPRPFIKFPPAAPHDLGKIFVSWNSALGDYGLWAPYYEKIRKRFFLPRRYSLKFISPTRTRDINVSCRIGLAHSSEIIRYHRKRIADFLQQRMTQAGNKISRIKYFSELQNAKIAVSPFGWGEICFRDFEIIANGAALFKPDLSHMETWPDLYDPGKTYIPFRWDLGDINDRIDFLLNGNNYLNIARNAQEAYRKYLSANEGGREFCRRINCIVERHLGTPR